MKDYEKIFELRGSQYNAAMQCFPDARNEEFEQLVKRSEVCAGMSIADVPAGGGYLKNYLPDSCNWSGHEPCCSFTGHGGGFKGSSSLLPLPWLDSSIDIAMSLAGLHHINDKRPLFIDLHRVVRQGGSFVLSDVAAGSDVANFLDDYVGRYNSTGHQGVFLDDRTLSELAETNWVVKSSEQVNIRWKFKNLMEMETFCNGLFDINKVQKGQTAEAIENILSVDELPDGSVGMRWPLMTIVSAKE